MIFEYNALGARTKKTDTAPNPDAVTTYEYDNFGNLKKVVLPGGKVVEYIIDVLGRRAGKLVNGVIVQRWIYLDQTRVAYELDATNEIKWSFVYGAKPNVPDYMIDRAGKEYRLVTDHLGSVLTVHRTDVSFPSPSQRVFYSPFGEAYQSVTNFQPFGFAGGLYDSDTKLVRFGARDYDPETGRWISKDPILFAGNQSNLYGYAFNDPVNFIDPLGLWGVFISTGAAAGISKSPGEKGGKFVDASSGFAIGQEGGGLGAGGFHSVTTGTNIAGATFGAGLNLGVVVGDISSIGGAGKSESWMLGPIGLNISWDTGNNISAFSLSLMGHGFGIGHYTSYGSTEYNGISYGKNGVQIQCR